MSGRLIGVGVGPGDPELMTLKAVRALGTADLVCHFAKAGAESHSRTIAARHLRPDIEELRLTYPMTNEIPKITPAYRHALTKFYDEAASAIAARLGRGQIVAVLCEGDPLFYASYMHLHTRLAPCYRTEVVAGVTGIAGCWSAAQLPMAQGDDVFAVVPATLSESDLTAHLRQADAAAIIKLGRHLTKVRRVLDAVGRLERAIYVEHGTMPHAVMTPLRGKLDDQAPYFAVVLVPGWELRP